MRASPSVEPVSKKPRLIIALLMGVVYLLLSVGTALTKMPFCDEAWYADPAFNLITNGTMGTPVIESAGTRLKGLDQHTYWVMPLYILAQAGWYKLVGGGALSSVRGEQRSDAFYATCC